MYFKSAWDPRTGDTKQFGDTRDVGLLGLRLQRDADFEPHF
jgi:hypothetical protein